MEKPPAKNRWSVSIVFTLARSNRVSLSEVPVFFHTVLADAPLTFPVRVRNDRFFLLICVAVDAMDRIKRAGGAKGKKSDYGEQESGNQQNCQCMGKCYRHLGPSFDYRRR